MIHKSYQNISTSEKIYIQTEFMNMGQNLCMIEKGFENMENRKKLNGEEIKRGLKLLMNILVQIVDKAVLN